MYTQDLSDHNFNILEDIDKILSSSSFDWSNTSSHWVSMDLKG